MQRLSGDVPTAATASTGPPATNFWVLYGPNAALFSPFKSANSQLNCTQADRDTHGEDEAVAQQMQAYSSTGVVRAVGPHRWSSSTARRSERTRDANRTIIYASESLRPVACRRDAGRILPAQVGDNHPHRPYGPAQASAVGVPLLLLYLLDRSFPRDTRPARTPGPTPASAVPPAPAAARLQTLTERYWRLTAVHGNPALALQSVRTALLDTRLPTAPACHQRHRRGCAARGARNRKRAQHRRVDGLSARSR
jgi:hypothetical protein